MARGVLLDIDGVLTVSWEPLPGAVETIRWLQDNAVPFRLVTNTSSKARQEIADLLSRAGMPVDVTQILTAVTSARRYLSERYRGEGCFVVNEGDLHGELEGVQLVGPESAGVVLLGGAGPRTGYVEFNAVFRLALTGVPVIGLHRNSRFQTADGPALDMGAFIVALEAAAGIDVDIVGKPAAAFFHAALTELGVLATDALIVGDDLEADVLGAQALGVTGVLVRTGKFRPSDLEHRLGTPNYVIDNVGKLPDLFARLAERPRD